jgi:hypothetical protein
MVTGTISIDRIYNETVSVHLLSSYRTPATRVKGKSPILLDGESEFNNIAGVFLIVFLVVTFMTTFFLTQNTASDLSRPRPWKFLKTGETGKESLNIE